MKKRRTQEIDVYDDTLMTALGIRSPEAKGKDPSVWTKTKAEKKALKSLRKVHKRDDMRFGTKRERPIPVTATLIVRLRSNQTFPKSVYSFKCGMRDIGRILEGFRGKKGNSLVKSYDYNKMRYLPDERPYWPW